MPFKNDEDKKRWAREWHERSKTNGYNKWLHQRRKVRFDDAAEFRAALETICEIGETRDVEVARDALQASKRRWKKLGEPPHRRRSDVKLEGLEIPDHSVEGDSLVAAMQKLGLS